MFPTLFPSQLIGLPVTPRIDLEADIGVTVSDGDKVDVWADQSGNGLNFTQTGSARPTLGTVDGYPCVQFDGVDDWMLGQNWATLDNLDNFTVIIVGHRDSTDTSGGFFISKMSDNFIAGAGWLIINSGNGSLIFGSENESGAVWVIGVTESIATGWYVMSFVWDTYNSVRLFLNGSPASLSGESSPPVTDISTTEPVRIGTVGNFSSFLPTVAGIRAIRIYAPTLSDAQRVAIEQELANRYGVVL